MSNLFLANPVYSLFVFFGPFNILSVCVGVCGCTLVDPFSAVDSPVVVAVVVDVSFAVKQESIAALFHAQRAIPAEEEVVAELRVRVRLLAMRFRTTWLKMLLPYMVERGKFQTIRFG